MDFESKTSTWALVVIVITFVVVLGMIWFTPLSLNPRFDMTLRALSSLGVMIALLSFVFAEMQRSAEQQRASIDSAVAVSQANAEQITGMFAEPELSRLFCQMHAGLESTGKMPACRVAWQSNSPITIPEKVASDRILSSIENVASYASVQIPDHSPEEVEEYWHTDPGFDGYLPLLRMWHKSSILLTDRRE